MVRDVCIYIWLLLEVVEVEVFCVVFQFYPLPLLLYFLND